MADGDPSSPGGTQVPLLASDKPAHLYRREAWTANVQARGQYHYGHFDALLTQTRSEYFYGGNMNTDTMNYDEAMAFLLETEQADVTHVINAATHLWAAYHLRRAIQWYRNAVMRHKTEEDSDPLHDIDDWIECVKLATIPKFLVEINEAVYTGDSPLREAKRSTKVGILDDAINAIFGTRYYVECRKASESFRHFAKQDHIFIAGFIAGIVDTSEQRRALRNGYMNLPVAASKDGRRLAAALLIGAQLS